jgi:hypothetical protein
VRVIDIQQLGKAASLIPTTEAQRPPPIRTSRPSGYSPPR